MAVMTAARLAILLGFAALLGAPFLFRPGQPPPPAGGGALQLIIITPHNEQIRYEFSRAFDAWHQQRFGQRVNVLFNVPGGTSEIRKMLEAQFTAALESGIQPGGDADLVFGGGSFEHGRLKRGVRIISNGADRYEPISAPVQFSDEWLTQTYGENRIGDDPLYDQDKHWFGTALSGFGIVFNGDALTNLGIETPAQWSDLCDARLQGWVALVNPGQSGSITTAFEAILKREGWERGWRILRRAGANARYFSGSSLKPPIDVSQGNAAMGVCIDFLGRYQSQAMREAGDADRIGYIDPPGGSTIDADPISMLRNAPHPEIARRFIEFCLSEQGQSLWQFPRHSREGGNPVGREGHELGSRLRGNDGGPENFELRRLPIIRSMYDKHIDRFVDRVNPYELAAPVEHPDPNFRDFIAPLFAAMAMDNHHDLRNAWRAITSHPAYPQGARVVFPADVSDPRLRQMLTLLDAMPTIGGPGGTEFSMADAAALGEIRSGWLKGAWRGHGLWNDQTTPLDALRKRCGEFFAANYQRIIELAEE